MKRIPPNVKLWFDLTTSFTHSSRNPFGLSRVEMNVVRAAISMPPERIRFCRFCDSNGTVQEIDRSRVERMLANFLTPKPKKGVKEISTPVKASSYRGGWIRERFRSLERLVRNSIRGTAYAHRNIVAKPAPNVRDPNPIKEGDYLFVSSSIWHFVRSPAFEAALTRNGIHFIAILADLIPWKFPQYYGEHPSSENFEEYAKLLIRKAEQIVTISKSGTADLLDLATQHGMSIDRKRISQVTLGSDFSIAFPERPHGAGSELEPGNFVLCVSTLQVRKNHQLLYHLWRRLCEEKNLDVPQLVLVGARGRLTDNLIHLMKHPSSSKDRILLLEHTNDAELAWLYRNCKFTVYPSLYEGWGLPIVESLQYGKACLASNSSSMPEAGQGLCEHLDPLDFIAWYKTIREWIEKPALVEAMERQMSTKYRRHSWDDFVQEIHSLLGSDAKAILKEAA